jgi:hypothetical protein
MILKTCFHQFSFNPIHKWLQLQVTTMSSAEEFSSPEILFDENQQQSQTVLFRQNAYDSPKSTCVDINTHHLELAGRHHTPRFEPISQSARAAQQEKESDELSTAFGDVWNKNLKRNTMCSFPSLRIPFETSYDESRALLGDPTFGSLVSTSHALNTASIERKYPTTPFNPHKNGLLATKLPVSNVDEVHATPEVDSTNSTPRFVDPRLLIRRRMMMRPSLVKKLAQAAQEEAEAEAVIKKVEQEKSVKSAEEFRAKNIKILNFRRKMMMRPSKIKQIAELESNVRMLEEAIAQMKSAKVAMLVAERKAENARILAVRRQMMQRPSKQKPLDVPKDSKTEDHTHTWPNDESEVRDPSASSLLESNLEDLLQKFSTGLRNGIFKADALVAHLEPAKNRGIYQSPMRRMKLQQLFAVEIPTD